jgi:hypothetical protein
VSTLEFHILFQRTPKQVCTIVDPAITTEPAGRSPIAREASRVIPNFDSFNTLPRETRRDFLSRHVARQEEELPSLELALASRFLVQLHLERRASSSSSDFSDRKWVENMSIVDPSLFLSYCNEQRWWHCLHGKKSWRRGTNGRLL